MSNKNANIGKAAKAEVPQTQAAEVATAPPKKVAHVVITPHMLEKLKTGPRVKVIVGLEGQRYIAIEAAFVNLLAHISPFAKKALVVDKAPVLSIPGGSKDEIMWIYKYAMAGQVQTTDKIEDMGFDKLITLYSHCQVLEYTEPMAKIEKQIRNRLNDEIPAPRVIIEIRNYIPSLKDLLVRSVGRVVLHPWVFNYDPYTDLADENAEFGKALDEIVEANLHKRIEAGEKYYNRDKKGSSLRLSDFLYMSIENGTVDNKHEEAFAKYDQLQYFNSVKCFNCGDAGHIANDCTQPKRPRGPKCYTCQEQGHVARDCPYAYNPPTCYKCNQVGHIARNCKAGADEAANDGPRPRNTQGRNKNFRRAQRERGSIEVNTNGEGIRTCDREVRPGEVTRTGLQI